MNISRCLGTLPTSNKLNYSLDRIQVSGNYEAYSQAIDLGGVQIVLIRSKKNNISTSGVESLALFNTSWDCFRLEGTPYE